MWLEHVCSLFADGSSQRLLSRIDSSRQRLFSRIESRGFHLVFQAQSGSDGVPIAAILTRPGPCVAPVATPFEGQLCCVQEAGLVRLAAEMRALPLPPPPPMERRPSASCCEGDEDAVESSGEEVQRTGVTPEHLLYWTKQEIIVAAFQSPAQEGHV